MKPIPYGRHEITDADIEQVIHTLKSDFLTQGPVIGEFEAALANFLGAKHVVAVTNGTAALHLAAMVLNVRPGDLVLCPPITFVASANCVRYCGGEVEFVDIDPTSFCIDLDALEKRLEKNKGRYKGIIAVDFAGHPVDFARLRELADRHCLWLLEDACHALGAEFLTAEGEWVKAGNGAFAELSVFSFHPVKHIATGEGGAIATNSDALAKRVRLLRTHGITKDPAEIAHPEQGWYMEMQELGYNYRIADLNAALGLSQMGRIHENLRRRREIASIYDEAFAPLGITTPPDFSRVRHAYHLYVVQVKERLKLYNFLRERGIFTQVHYIPVCDQPYYVDRYGRAEVPIARAYYGKSLSLPMYPSMTNADVQRVINAVLEFHGIK
jgi:UDP-4-amino-4,6-dideoxy-N-acetyl-beta-L-altrosamine transaminase